MIELTLRDLFRYLKYKTISRGYFALNNLDKKLKKYINYRDGYFVELGANDGFTQSNTLYFEQNKGWRGILIEPSLNLFIKCTSVRSKKNNKFFCCACVPFEFKDHYVDIEYKNLMSISKNLNLDIVDIDHFLSLGDEYTPSIINKVKFGAQARTLQSILIESQAPTEIDLLSLDAEGAEFSVLSGINFNKFTFKYILVETRVFQKIDKFLSGHGYVFVEALSNNDYLFAKDTSRVI